MKNIKELVDEILLATSQVEEDYPKTMSFFAICNCPRYFCSSIHNDHIMAWINSGRLGWSCVIIYWV